MSAVTRYWILVVGVPMAGLALVIIGAEFEASVLIGFGLLVLAAAAIGNGVMQVRTREFMFQPPAYRIAVLERWEGPSAVFFGYAFIVAGAWIGAAALAHLGGLDADALGALLLARPGLVLAPLGLFLLAVGAGYVAGFQDGHTPARGALWNCVMSLPNRMGGVILLALGAAAFIVGLFELLEPAHFARSLRALIGG